MRTALFMTAAAAALALVACGEKPAEEAAAPPAETAAAPPAAEPAAAPAAATPQQTIETRQANLKDMGANFKTINDQLKAGTPDVAAITAAADKIKGYSAEIGTWFPAGTGAEAGIKTAALPKIWEDPATFQAAVAKFQEQASAFQTAAHSGDIAQIKPAAAKLGPDGCKQCHDNFRAKDDKK
jgi:cytochrome c556